LVQGYVERYNNTHLNSAIGYITPKDMLAGLQQEIQVDRDRKLETAREKRKNCRQRDACSTKRITSGWATIQPELMDACLDWMERLSIDASWPLS
jgi:hypothetical protein